MSTRAARRSSRPGCDARASASRTPASPTTRTTTVFAPWATLGTASDTHRLLLKQWLKEEDLLACHVTLREARLNDARKEIAFLYCAFFAFHAASVLFLSSSLGSDTLACRRSWIPCLVSLLSSLAMLWALRYKAETEAVLERVLAREQEDAALLGRCVAELKRKGLEFDLLKEVDALRRAKSLRIEAKGGAAADGPRRWPARDLPVFALFGAACSVLVLTRFLLCNN